MNIKLKHQRTCALIGVKAFNKLQSAHVGVFGLGGVGAYAAESLVRSGVGALSVIDFDKIEETNINRQNLAFTNTIGKSKVELFANKAKYINEDCRIFRYDEFYTPANSDFLKLSEFDVVIDAIDSFESKIFLITECLKYNVNIFSAMGAAGKLEPSKIKIDDIFKTSVCPLAKKIRKRLKALNIKKGFKVVYSIEQSAEPLKYENINKQIRLHKNEINFKRLNYKNTILLGSISYIPPIFGLMLAGLAIQKITGLNSALQVINATERINEIYGG